MQERKRYTKLEPFNIDKELEISVKAAIFFSPQNYRKMCEEIGASPNPKSIVPFSGRDFLKYLEKTNTLTDADKYIFLIRDLLNKLSRNNILTEQGKGQDIMIGTHYYFIKELTNREKEGLLWLSPALGPQYIYRELSKSTIQLTGVTSNGDAHAGTGIVINKNWALTCAHVVDGMELDSTQEVGKESLTIEKTLSHEKYDVALVKFRENLSTLNGLSFRDANISETVYTLGFPRIPLSRSPELIMQRGEITSEKIKTFSGDEIFLYSAIARPGNSGGPIISTDGHVVGIVTEELSEEASQSGMPFYAGVGTSEIIKAVAELEETISIPVENYE